jgi:hypothetical protein
MAASMTAEDILPFVSGLTPTERVRLLRLITEQDDADDAAVYAAVPPRRNEFSNTEDALDWEAEGWEQTD